MNEPGSLNPEQYFILQEYLETWQQPEQERPSVYDMPQDVTDVMAAANIFTTSLGVATADKGVSPKDFLKQKGYELDLEVIAGHTTNALRNVPEFKEAARTDEFGHNELGSALARTFGEVTAITAYNVHVTKPKIVKGKAVDGTVTAERMTLTIPSRAHCQSAIAALQALLITAGGETCGVVPAVDEAGKLIGAEIRGLNEHMARSLSRAFEALMTNEDRRKYGTVIPTLHQKRIKVKGKEMQVLEYQKLSLVELRKRNETFHPVVEDRLEAADAGYKALTLKASYTGSEDFQEVTTNKQPDYHLLATDVAGVLQGMRDIFNVEIRRLRGGGHRNSEQDPDKKSRLRIDNGTNLKRDRATPAATKKGPLAARRLTPHEYAREEGTEVVRRVRANPLKSSIEFVEVVTDLGIAHLVFAGLKNTLRMRHGTQRTVEIRRWLEERRKLQDPGYLVQRLSWLAHIGSQYNLDKAGKQRLDDLKSSTRLGAGRAPRE